MPWTAQNRDAWRVNQYVWLSIGFTLCWVGAHWAHFSRAEQRTLALVLLAAIVNTGTRSGIALRSPQGTTGQLGWVFTGVDIVLIAAAVRMTGGWASDLWLLYFLVCVTETLSVSVKAEALLLALTFAGLGAALWPISDWLGYGTRLFFLYAVSAIARRLHLNADARNRQVAALREQLGVAQEQGRVARELHDGLGREIVNVILGLEVARRVAERQPEQVSPLLEENLALLRTAMDDTRALIFQTRPWTAEDGGPLGERIARYARQFSDRSGIAVTVDDQWGDRTLTPQAAFGLLRIVQEALNNVAKHAQARRVTLTLLSGVRALTVEIADDGRGFDAAGFDPNAGIGLAAMRERAQALGGSVAVTSAPGRGTVVTVATPWRKGE